MEPLLAIAVVFIVAGIAWLVIEKIMAALGIQPADPDERAGGFQDVIDRFQAWAERRRNRD